MIRKLHINENNNSFDKVAFRKYIENMCEDGIFNFEGQYPVEIIEKEFPGYNGEWCTFNMDSTIKKARDKAIKALADYQMLALLYEKPNYNESINRNKKSIRESVYGYEDTKWIDEYGEMGENGAIWTFQELKDYWDNNHDSDPLLVLHKEQDPDFDFEDWFYDTIGNMKEYNEY